MRAYNLCTGVVVVAICGCSLSTRVVNGPPCSVAPPIIDGVIAAAMLTLMATTSCKKESGFDSCGSSSSQLHTTFVVLPATVALLAALVSGVYGVSSVGECRDRRRTLKALDP